MRVRLALDRDFRPVLRDSALPAHLVRLPARSLQVHWPEGNVLVPAAPEHREPGSHVPDYNAVVTLERR